MKRKDIDEGYGIVVADRGFVYVGHIVVDAAWCVVTDARNIRKWGTTKGLGEIARGGPTKDTVLDDVGTVRIPVGNVMHIIDSEASKWM